MGKINSKKKGSRGERELAAEINKLFPGSGARRSQQFCGAVAGDADLKTLIPKLHLECKRTEKLNLSKAIEQATNDAGKTASIPVVASKKNRENWLVTCWLDDLPALAALLVEFKNRKEEGNNEEYGTPD